MKTVGEIVIRLDVHQLFERGLVAVNAGKNEQLHTTNGASETVPSDPVDPLKTRPSVEIAVETQNRSNSVALHNRNVHCVAGRHQRSMLGDLPSAQNLHFLDGDHFVDDVQRNLERRSNGFALFDSRIPMENLLQHRGISDQPLPCCNQALQDYLRLGLVWMRGSNQVHRDIRVDERSTLVASFNFAQHLGNVGGRKGILCGTSYRLQLRFGFAYRSACARFPQRSPNPFTNRKPFALRKTLNVLQFLIREQDLKALTHEMSIR